ncbi:MAG: DUF4129 domain-containing protein [Desulfobacteraceae bacterium]|nr:MAG: DUF4129 domain-containing protein [Desulfobacteraceae bacterium]
MAGGLVAQTMKAKDAFCMPGALDLTEQAVHLLRRKGGAALADYYIGSLPFTLGLLFFWSDMSRDPYASGYCAQAAAGLAALFVWMKVWQARFCRRLWCALNHAPPEPWGRRRCFRVAARQAALHALGLAVLPIAALIMLPLGWVYAFYQNVGILDGPETRGLRHLYRDAVHQAALWPGQNHLLLSVISLFGLFVLLNVAIGLLLLPYVFKWLSGIETAFTISGLHALTNTTFVAVVAVLTYLCTDPLVKAAYTLRCFYGLSRHSGDDLRAAITSFSRTLLVLVLVGTVSAPLSWAATMPAADSPGDAGTSPDDGYTGRLDEAIERVLQQRRFAWRLPREKTAQPPADQEGWLARSLRWLSEKSMAAFEAVDRWLEAAAQWLRKRFPAGVDDPAGGADQRAVIRLVFYGLGGALILLSLWGVRRWLIARRVVRQPAVLSRPAREVDINDDAVSAADLPCDRWLALAQELTGRGEFRQALRALYLSVLAQLGEHGRVSIARYKSNRDYRNELARRAHAEPELVERFDHCMTAFERTWYGMHPVEKGQLSRFRAAQERIDRLVQHTA